MSQKDLTYYKNLEYKILVEKIKEDDITGYIAYTIELGKYACYGQGDTQAEAIERFLIEKEEFIEYLFKNGETIIEPEYYENYSGVFNVRTSPLIHAKLVTQARQMNVSLNLYLNQILAGVAEKRTSENVVLDKIGELCGKMDSQHFEVTRQLTYQTEKLQNQYKWHQDYGIMHIKVA